jgi:hypothetical protein
MDAIEFLIQKRILTDRDLDKKWPLNLSRDCHIKSAKDIVKAMEEYAEYKSDTCDECGANKPCDC